MYPDNIKESICERLADGQSLREICACEGFPGKSTVMRWLQADDEFRDQYARAKEIGVEALAEDILDIADDAQNDWMERKDPQGRNAGWVVNGESARRSQIRIDARKWLLSKLAPKKYGDRVDLNHSGTIGLAAELTALNAHRDAESGS